MTTELPEKTAGTTSTMEPSIKGTQSETTVPAQDEIKIDSLKGNTRPLRRGDLVLNQYNEAAVVITTFWKDYKRYGMTSADILDKKNEDGAVIKEGKVDDLIFAFYSDQKDDIGRYVIVEVGWVVEIDRVKNTCVFGLFRGFYSEKGSPLVDTMPKMELSKEFRLKFDTVVEEKPHLRGIHPYRQRGFKVKMNIVEAPPYSGVIPERRLPWIETDKENL